MKRILLALTISALLLPALREAKAATEVSIDFFYDNLGTDGDWVEVADYGYCWQPSVAVSNSKWRPYSDGYWAYTDVGWTWVSYEDFGWATYHYGRWTRLRDRGWFWVPGHSWGPAWVSWRTGGDQIGWAPLPPRRGRDFYDDEQPITSQVDVEFDIGPSYYNFVDVRYIGEPVLRERIYAPEQNVTYISTTVNVTNITYRNSMAYNYGPDYDTVNRYSTRPVQRLSIQRDANADPRAAARSKALISVQGDRLVVAAPTRIQRAPTPIAPKVVKEKIAKPEFEHGWTGDPKSQADLRQKMKTEDPKKVAPPTVKARENAPTAASPNAAPAASTTAAPATGASPAASAPPAPTSSAASTAPAAPAASTTPAVATSPVSTPPGKKTGPREKPVPPVAPPAPAAPSASGVPPTSGTPAAHPKPKDKRRENIPPAAPSATAPGGNEAVAPSAPPREKANKKINPADKAPESPRDKAPGKPKDEMNPATAPVTSAPPAPPKHEAAPPKHEAAPPKHEAPPPKHEAAPPKREAPPEAPLHKQPPTDAAVPKERTAPPPPPGPGANAPAKPEGPANKKGPDHKKPEPSATPGQ
jgi:hypothetical protein